MTGGARLASLSSRRAMFFDARFAAALVLNRYEGGSSARRRGLGGRAGADGRRGARARACCVARALW